MSLVAQQIGGGIRENSDGAVVGWDKRLYRSPRKKHNKTGSGKMKIISELELQEKKLSPAELLLKLEERTPLRDKLTPLSDHSGTPFSNQYSDSYFSIDLAKSYSTHHGRRSQVPREVGSDQITLGTTNSKGQCEKGSDALFYWPFNDSYAEGQQNKVNNAAFYIKEGPTTDFGKSTSRQRIVKKNPNQSIAKRSVDQDQTIAKSESISISVLSRFTHLETDNDGLFSYAEGAPKPEGVGNPLWFTRVYAAFLLQFDHNFNGKIDLEEFNNETKQMMLGMAEGLGFYTCLKLTTTLTNLSSAKFFDPPSSRTSSR
ncbi:hypothetical protein JHK87_042541 [Glycine soja]|nr:hypothetical protein JHK87_042541 [Glycine soja]